MLDPNSHRTYLQELRPPVGCQLDFAIATTYSSDLLAYLQAGRGPAQLLVHPTRDLLYVIPPFGLEHPCHCQSAVAIATAYPMTT